MRRAIALIALSTLVPIAGCSVSNSVSGRATKVVPTELFDPCTLPDDALRRANVDPATAAPDFFGVQSEGWEVCAWEADWYYVTVFVTDVTVEEFRSRPKNIDFRSVDIGARDAHSFRSIYASERGLCDVIYASAEGTVLVRASAKGTELSGDDGIPEDPCTVAVRTAVSLDPYIPE